MTNQAVFRCTTEGPDAPLRFACCGELAPGGCTCEGPPTSRGRQSAKEVEPTTAADLVPPDPFAAAIAAKRAALGYPVAAKTTTAGSVHEFKVGARPVFPMKPNVPPDGYEANIQALRKRRGIKPASALPADYDGAPPDPYAARVAALRAEVA